MPLVKRIHQDKGARGLEIVAITRDPVPKAAALRSTLKVPYTVASDPRSKVMKDYLINPIPAFILVDAKGVVRALAVGAGWPQQLTKMLALADKLLGAGASAPPGVRPLPPPRGAAPRPAPSRRGPAPRATPRPAPETF